MEIEWAEYLQEIAKNSFTGTWAKDVAENLFNRELTEEHLNRNSWILK